MAGVSASDIKVESKDPEAIKAAKEKLIADINADEKRIAALGEVTRDR